MGKTTTNTVAAIVLGLLGTSCSGDAEPTAAEKSAAAQQEEEEAEASAAAEAERQAEIAAAEEEERERQQQEQAGQRRAACMRQTKGLLSSLEELDSRLSIGLNFSEYGDRVGDVQVAYDRLPIGQLSPSCIRRVGVPLESAFNSYTKVYQVWNDCIDDFDCDFNEGEPNRKAQNGWQKAGRLVERGRTGLRKIGQVQR